ncbi:MAG TPA: DinB family protein [Ignavibacteria bacterium]|nr:DinB family protein [Ignavibacteria bacterium]
MAAEEVKLIMKYNGYVFGRNLEEISNEESLTVPDSRVNTVNWVAGHLVNSRDDLLEDIGRERILQSEYAEYYGRGKSLPGPEAAIDIDTIKKDYDRLTEEINKVLAEGDAEKDQRVAFFMFHESYHAGQLGILRKLIGKQGKMK